MFPEHICRTKKENKVCERPQQIGALSYCPKFTDFFHFCFFITFICFRSNKFEHETKSKYKDKKNCIQIKFSEMTLWIYETKVKLSQNIWYKKIKQQFSKRASSQQ